MVGKRESLRFAIIVIGQVNFGDLQEKPTCIPQNTEKFISFSLKKSESSEIRFLDSYGFMNFPLATLVKS